MSAAPRVRVHRLVDRAEAERLAPELDALGRSALGDASFSLVHELERPFGRVWVAGLSPDPLSFTGERARISSPSPVKERGPGGEAAGPRGEVGFLVAWDVADELHVLQVAVAPEARRAGVGRALVEAALAEARATSKRIALLEVRASNAPALALYRAFGFDLVHVRKRYYSNPEEDALELLLELGASSSG